MLAARRFGYDRGIGSLFVHFDPRWRDTEVYTPGAFVKAWKEKSCGNGRL
jgi:hypothetical protein